MSRSRKGKGWAASGRGPRAAVAPRRGGASAPEGRPWWRIAEPTTTLTDVALAALTVALGADLLRRGAAGGETEVLLWGGAFVATSVSALLGAGVHGLAPWLAAGSRDALWRATLIVIGITNFLLAAAVVVAELEGAARVVLGAAVTVKLGIYLGRLRTRDDFRIAAVDSGVALLLVLALELWSGLAHGAAGAGWIVGGVLLSLVGAGAQQTGWSLHRHFNHNDLFHVVQMAAAYLLYRGGLLL